MTTARSTIHSRPITHRWLAIALAAVALVSSSGVAAAAEWEVVMEMGATAKLKAKKVGTLKVPVSVRVYMGTNAQAGVWSARDHEDGTLYLGSYYAANRKYTKFSVAFSQPALEQLAGTLENLVLDEAGLYAEVVSISQRNAKLTLSKKQTKASLKLVFDIGAYVDGVYRTATYTIPLKGNVIPAQLGRVDAGLN